MPEFDENEKFSMINCPRCGEPLVFPRGDIAYCEECGWPDEDFDEQ